MQAIGTPITMTGVPDGLHDLFELDGCAGFGQLGLDLFGFGLRNAFLQGFRGTVDEVLGFLEAKARNDFANDLDDGDLVAAGGRENDIKRVLFFGRRSTRRRRRQPPSSSGPQPQPPKRRTLLRVP